MTERLGNMDQAFNPVIFDEDETEFIMRPVSEVGYHFKHLVAEAPVLTEGEKLEVADEAMAGFVTSCLSYWIGLSERRIAAHHRASELDQEYTRRRLSLTQQQNVRRDIERSTAIIERTQVLISRLGPCAVDEE